MTIKKKFVMMGAIMILGASFIVAAENPQTQEKNAVQKRVETRFQVRTQFVDENGDGICDLVRDRDNDGIPNCQDPDQSRPEDGTGNKNRKGNNSSSNQLKNRKGYHGGNTWNSQSSRQNRASFGNGICDGSGSKGKGSKGGRG